MAKQLVTLEQQKTHSASRHTKARETKATTTPNLPTIGHLGNRALQRLLAQRSGGGALRP